MFCFLSFSFLDDQKDTEQVCSNLPNIPAPVKGAGMFGITQNYLKSERNRRSNPTPAPTAPLARYSPSKEVIRGAISMCAHGLSFINCHKKTAPCIAPP